MILTLILLAQLGGKPKPFPDPAWTEKPVPHWHCPSGFHIDTNTGVPLCISPDKMGHILFGYEPTTQELVTWGWVKVLPASGKLRIDYPKEFIRMPGCQVTDKTDEATNRVTFSDESKAGFTLHGKPGHKLHLNCHGVIQRPVERSSN